MANHDVKAVHEAVTTSEQFNTRKLYVSHDYLHFCKTSIDAAGCPFELPAEEILL
jgi:hypothetical protein